jgi:hypothetical protein
MECRGAYERQSENFGGTRSSATPRLCDTCQSGIVTRGASDSDEQVFCLITNQRIHRSIVGNRYVNRNLPSLWHMRQIAWVLDIDAKRQRIGFVRAEEWERKHNGEELLPSHLDQTATAVVGRTPSSAAGPLAGLFGCVGT